MKILFNYYMETHTTNINELPIEQEKKVSFNDDEQITPTIHPKKLNTVHKVIIVSTLLFILFNEPFIKNYILNIIEVIVGKIYVKDINGSINKSGILLYALVYGSLLYLFNLIIDIDSLEI